MNAVDAAGLGRRYLRTWALKECCLAIPPGRVTALVGAKARAIPRSRTWRPGCCGPHVSSHILAELERIADHLVVLSRGRVQVAGDVDHPLATHATLTGPTGETDEMAERRCVITGQRAGAQSHLLVRTGPGDERVPPGWTVHPVSLEDLVLAYLREPAAAALQGPGTAPVRTGVPA